MRRMDEPAESLPADVGPDDAAVPGSIDWWEDRRAGEVRRRPRVDGLTVERIVARAIELVDAEGLAALTVRGLARRLGTGSASLYRHVASRDELIVLMVDHVIGEVERPGPELPGPERVRVLARELRRVLMDHSQLLPALTAAPLLGPNAVSGAEVALVAMLDSGHDETTALSAVLALIDFVLGTVYFDTSSAGRSFAAERGGGDPNPLLPDPDDVFDFGLDTFLAGLAQRLG